MAIGIPDAALGDAGLAVSEAGNGPGCSRQATCSSGRCQRHLIHALHLINETDGIGYDPMRHGDSFTGRAPSRPALEFFSNTAPEGRRRSQKHLLYSQQFAKRLEKQLQYANYLSRVWNRNLQCNRAVFGENLQQVTKCEMVTNGKAE